MSSPAAMIAIIPLKGLIIGLVVLLSPISSSAQERRPHAVLVLDQSDSRGPFYYQLWSGLRGVLGAHDARVTIYGENLDLTRFGGAAYEQSLKRHFKEKYRDRQIGVIVTLGPGSFEHTLRWREELWPGIPIVFAMLDETDFARLERPADVTGVVIKNSLTGAVRAARAVVRNLDTIAFVGDDWERQSLFNHWEDEIPSATSENASPTCPSGAPSSIRVCSPMARARTIRRRRRSGSSLKGPTAPSWSEPSRYWPQAESADTP
jgi:hypothetical protein